MDREPYKASVVINSCFCLQTQNTGVSSVFCCSILNRNQEHQQATTVLTAACIAGAVAVCKACIQIEMRVQNGAVPGLFVDISYWSAATA